MQQVHNDRCNIPGALMTVHDGGRLGNNMGEYATLYAHSKRLGIEPYITQHMKRSLQKVTKYYNSLSI